MIFCEPYHSPNLHNIGVRYGVICNLRPLCGFRDFFDELLADGFVVIADDMSRFVFVVFIVRAMNSLRNCQLSMMGMLISKKIISGTFAVAVYFSCIPSNAKLPLAYDVISSQSTTSPKILRMP